MQHCIGKSEADLRQMPDPRNGTVLGQWRHAEADSRGLQRIPGLALDARFRVLMGYTRTPGKGFKSFHPHQES